MIWKIVGGLAVLLGIFLGYVSTRDGKFTYERSGVINASPEKIFPYISQFKLGSQWSPYEKGIEMPKKYEGTDGTLGSAMEFGPSASGSGRLEILELVPNQMVKLSLRMTAPFDAQNIVIYRLTPEKEGTRFSWTMQGDGGFLGKLMTTIIDCEKMVAGQFLEGIQNLKQLVESQGETKEAAMNLTEKPEVVTIPRQHFLFVEKNGPFQETAQKSWEEIHKIYKALPTDMKKVGAMALFKMQPQMIYRAGFIFDKKPAKIPEGAEYIEFQGGKYSKFTLTGPYGNLGPAWGRTMEMVKKLGISMRDEYFIENYLNDPAIVKETELVSELMIPTM